MDSDVPREFLDGKHSFLTYLYMHLRCPVRCYFTVGFPILTNATAMRGERSAALCYVTTVVRFGAVALRR